MSLPIVTPIYLNSANVVSLFRSTVETLSLDFNLNRNTIVFKTTLPLSELTCGRITQGTGTVEYTREYINATIDAICQSATTAFLKLYNILEDNSLMKHLNTASDFNSLRVGDVIEIQCPLFKDPEVKNLFSMANSLELQMLINSDDKSIENKSSVNVANFLAYLKTTLDKLENNYCVDYFSKLLFSKYRIVTALSKDNFESSLTCIEDKPLTIVGKVSYIEPYLKETMVDTFLDPIEKFVKTNNITFPYAENFDFEEDTPYYIGIVPLSIHL